MRLNALNLVGLALALAGVAGCAGSAAAPAGAPGPSCATANISPDKLADTWWEEGDAACPAGATLKVIDERKSTVRMCLLNGKKHGPFRIAAKDALMGEGWYVYGAKHGPWRRYDGITQQYVIETYNCDQVLERVPDPNKGGATGETVRNRRRAKGTFDNPRPVDPFSPKPVPGLCPSITGKPQLMPDGTWQCGGRPFTIKLPVTAGVKQFYGNGYVTLQYVGPEGVLLVSTTVGVADMSRVTQKRYRGKTLPGYPARLLNSLGIDRLEITAPTPMTYKGADFGFEQTLSTGPIQSPIEGVSRVFLIRGWMIHLLISGRKDQAFHRDGKVARAFLSSLTALSSGAGWRWHRYPDGAQVMIPADAWEVTSGASPQYAVPSIGGFIRFESGRGKSQRRNHGNNRDCELLNEQQWMQVAGSITPQQNDPLLRFIQSEWLSVSGTKMLWVEAETRTKDDLAAGLPFRPAVVVDVCSGGLFHRIYTLSIDGSLRDVIAHADKIARTFRGK